LNVIFIFSPSSLFSYSIVFSRSYYQNSTKEFSTSQTSIGPSYFSETHAFWSSNIFSLTLYFHGTNYFTSSEWFSLSTIFSFTKVFQLQKFQWFVSLLVHRNYFQNQSPKMSQMNSQNHKIFLSLQILFNQILYSILPYIAKWNIFVISWTKFNKIFFMFICFSPI
jgi:hypothetical protein